MLLNDPKPRFQDFYDTLTSHRITLWGAAVDTLETPPVRRGQAHPADERPSPLGLALTVTQPYEAYFLALPAAWAAERGCG